MYPMNWNWTNIQNQDPCKNQRRQFRKTKTAKLKLKTLLVSNQNPSAAMHSLLNTKTIKAPGIIAGAFL